MVALLYGTGMRLMECVRLPARLENPLREPLNNVRALHTQDLAQGFGQVWLPDALEHNRFE